MFETVYRSLAAFATITPTMDEVTGILIAVGAMIGGLLLLGWAFGDFNKPPNAG